jgi:protein-S-isoprenylcysteine O-methyltransferase Ste14
MNQRQPERFRFFFKVRGLVMIPPLLFVLFSVWGHVDNKVLTLGLGSAVFCVGWFLRIWAQIHLHYRLRVKKILTTTGPYQFTRNPIYIGNAIILLGLCLVSGIVWFLPIMFVYSVLIYSFVVRYEEAHLENKYGAPYEAYLAAVPRWIPRLSQPQMQDAPDVLQYLWPSVKAEMYNVLYLLPFLVKQLFF